MLLILERSAPLSCLLLVTVSAFLACREDTGRHAADLPRAEAEVIATLGAVDHPVLGFASVNGLAVREHIYVLQTSRQHVAVIDRKGNLVRRLGRRGQGPAEFITPTGLGLRGDTLWVMDNGPGRISYFEGSRLVAEERFAAAALPPDLRTAATIPLEGGAVLAVATREFNAPPGSPDNFFPLIRLGDQESGDTVALLREASPFRATVGSTRVGPLFSDFPLLHVNPDGSGLVVIDRPIPSGDTARIRVTKVTSLGDTSFTRTIVRAAVPMPRTVWDSAVDDQMGKRRRPFTWQEYAAVMPPPAAFPPASRVLLSEKGDVWVALEAVPGRETVPWLRLDGEGHPQFIADLPAEFRGYAAYQDELWGVVRGEFDEPYLRGYRMKHNGG